MVTGRRRRAWADIRLTNVVTSGGELTLTDLLPNLAAAETKTVTRLIVDLDCAYQDTNEVEGTNVVDLGVAVCSEEAFLLGTTAVPDPNQSDEYPQFGWLYIATRMVMQSLPTGGTPTAMWRYNAVFKADIRTQRKVDRGRLFLKLQNTSVNNGQSIQVIGRVRALCLT